MNCWVEDNCVLYEHYTKPMASSLVIPQRSAVPRKVKRATIAQMAVKILENTSLELPWSRKAQLLSNLSLRIKQSGYNASFRLNIFKSALKCWERRLQMDQSGDKPLHRVRNWKREERQKEKERKKETWYTKKEENPRNAFPIFCPPTPKSTLASSWKQIAEEIKEQSNGLVSPKIVEQGGVPLKNLVTRTSPMETDKCEKQDCPVCISVEGKNKQCLKTTQGGAGYTITCTNCRSDNILSVYHGETSRTLYSSLVEHARGHNNKQEENPLFKHDENVHEGERQEYVYKAERFFRDPLTRQIHEGVRINKSLEDTNCKLMNSKSEFRQGVVPRIKIKRGLNSH